MGLFLDRILSTLTRVIPSAEAKETPKPIPDSPAEKLLKAQDQKKGLQSLEKGIPPPNKKTAPPQEKEKSFKIQCGTEEMTVKEKFFTKHERGSLEEVNAVVLHQTDSDTAEQTFNAWKDKPSIAHFVIDKDGTTYQTAHLDKVVWHIGKVRSRCQMEGDCTPEEKGAIGKIWDGKGKFTQKAAKVSARELSKDYPDRYPLNSESIGIEVVGKHETKKGYPAPTAEQKKSLDCLVTYLKKEHELTNDDLYHHGIISRKDDEFSEGTQMGYTTPKMQEVIEKLRKVGESRIR